MSYEEEQLALAIQLSLAEAKSSESKPSEEDLSADLALALHLQEEENEAIKTSDLKPPLPRYSVKGDGQHDHSRKEERSNSVAAKTSQSKQSTNSFSPDCCARCGNNLRGAPQRSGTSLTSMMKDFAATRTTAIVNANGLRYHPECFTCEGCNERLTGHFSKRPDGSIYCLPCHEQLFSFKCYLCGIRLQGRAHMHPFFDSPDVCGEARRGYCPRHEDEQESCVGCQRKEPCGEGAHGSHMKAFHRLTDGRPLCDACISSAIMDSEAAKELYLEAVHFLRRLVGPDQPFPREMTEIPVLCVDRNGMGEHQRSAVFGHHRQTSSQTRGMTLKTETHVRHFSRDESGALWSPWSSSVGQTQRRDEVRREVTAVLLLCGMPREEAAAVLVHEALHVWCALNARMPSHLPPQVEEGLCEYVASEFLVKRLQELREEESRKSARGNHGNANGEDARWSLLLLEFQLRKMSENPCPVYGEGFRQAARCCEVLPFPILLDHIAAQKSFPHL